MTRLEFHQGINNIMDDVEKGGRKSNAEYYQTISALMLKEMDNETITPLLKLIYNLLLAW